MSLNHKDILKATEIITEVIGLMGVDLHPEVSADVSGLKVNLVGKDSAIIIGYHGETLADTAYILGIILRNQLAKDVSIRIDAGDYLKAKDTRIKELAKNAIKKVKRSGFPETLTGLNSYERRLVHDEAGKEGLISASEGTGSDRKLVIKPHDSVE